MVLALSDSATTSAQLRIRCEIAEMLLHKLTFFTKLKLFGTTVIHEFHILGLESARLFLQQNSHDWRGRFKINILTKFRVRESETLWVIVIRQQLYSNGVVDNWVHLQRNGGLQLFFCRVKQLWVRIIPIYFHYLQLIFWSRFVDFLF